MGLRGPKLNTAILEETKKTYDACNKNMAEVGRKLGISRERVRQRLTLYAKYHSNCTSIIMPIIAEA